MYKLKEALEIDGVTSRDELGVGQVLEPMGEFTVGQPARFSNVEDSHLYHRVFRTKELKKIVKRIKEMVLETEDGVYIFEQL